MWARAATWKRSEVIRTRIIIMVVLGTFLLRRSGYVRKRTYLPNPLAAAGLVRGPAAVRDIVPRTIFNNKYIRMHDIVLIFYIIIIYRQTCHFDVCSHSVYIYRASEYRACFSAVV